MRWLILGLLLCAFTPLYPVHDTPAKVDDEIKNVADSVQDEQLTVFTSTPILSQLKDGQMVIFSSGTVKLMFRQNQEIFAVSVSCITVRR